MAKDRRRRCARPLHPPRCPADGRHRRLRRRGLVPGLRVLQGSTQPSQESPRPRCGRPILLLTPGFTCDEYVRPGHAGSPSLPGLRRVRRSFARRRKPARSTGKTLRHSQGYSLNSRASSAHSPAGAIVWYARQCGRASSERPSFSSATARYKCASAYRGLTASAWR